MKRRLLHIGLLLTSLLGYMTWGGGNQSFLFQAEWALLTGGGGKGSFTHPLVLLPMAGQLLLLLSIFQRRPSRKLATASVWLLGLLLFFILLAGMLGSQPWMVFSVLPFTLLAIVHFRMQEGT